ncbi:sialate O-acetylesterase [Compostibacter hankyongensis]|uniref:Sialate O-acetylesterase n=2 Tax=Compostibacter hankyongensis TaxID=1007089 RepID=A0ABP8FR47_9BACT
MRCGILLLFLSYITLNAGAAIRLPAIITDSMVLQQRSEAPVWGWASPGEAVSVEGSWAKGSPVSTKADEQGKWMVKLKTPAAGGPYTLTIRGEQTLVLHDIMIGEVWVCSGQSNMEMPVSGWKGAPLLNSEQEIAAANYPNIRLFTVKKAIATDPQEDCSGSWSACSPQTVAGFSAAAYFFGRQLYQKLHVPIGLIHTSWGGTVAEAWTSSDALRTLGDFNAALDQQDSLRKMSAAAPKDPNHPSLLYNGMIAPIVPFGIKGAIWYQGESNVGRAAQYEKLFPTMITDWRNRWKEGNFPFYFVQIAPYKYGGDGIKSAALRDAQRKSLGVPNTGMVVTLDIATPDNIHPANKEEVGRRLALWALARTYGQKGIVYSGPLYKKLQVKGNRAILSFDYAKDGLNTKGGPLSGFELAGADGNFVPAEAAVKGNKVVVRAATVSHPTAVRYDWTDTSTAHLFNKAGLPASSFTAAL